MQTNLLQIVHGQVRDVDGEEAPDVEAECGHGKELSIQGTRIGGFSTLRQFVIFIALTWLDQFLTKRKCNLNLWYPR